MRKTKIVCTIGPVSNDVDTLCQLISAGMNVARLNFSHGDHQQHLDTITNIRQAEKMTGKFIGIMLDTKGPEIRTHDMKDGEYHVFRNDDLAISGQKVLGGNGIISVTYENLIHEVHEGTRILIDDGLIELEVVDLDFKENLIHTKVRSNGTIRDKKGVNIPDRDIQLPNLTEKDYEDIYFGLYHGINFIASSFTRNPETVLEIREIIEETENDSVQIIPKIENQTGVDNIEEILKVSDGIMVARGDLGVEIPPQKVPLVQKMLIELCNQAGKPVITSTQMLDSMQWNPRPTRAEANDVANAIFDGSDAIMLSGETALGSYPVEATQMMNAIAETTETSNIFEQVKAIEVFDQHNMTEAIGQAVADTTKNLAINSIVAYTDSGYTARMISKYRPKAQILAVTTKKDQARALNLVWGVEAVVIPTPASTDEMFEIAEELVQEKGFAQAGEMFIVTAGVPIGESGTTNLMRIQTINKQILKGLGIGNQSVIGYAKVVDNAEEANQSVESSSILVLKSTDKAYLPAMQACAGIIAEKGGLTGHTAIMALELGKPLIIGAENATQLIENNQVITLDSRRGIVYAGETKTI